MPAHWTGGVKEGERDHATDDDSNCSRSSHEVQIMCQAYEAERSLCLIIERQKRDAGYEAAKNGEPKIPPSPYWAVYWAQGYDCFLSGSKPWWRQDNA